MSNTGPIVAVAVAMPVAAALILQGTGMIDLTHAARAKSPPSVQSIPIGTPTALADPPLKAGAAGIVLPAPAALGTLTRADVAEGYARVKTILAAAHLEPGTVFEGETRAYTDLLAAYQRTQFLHGLNSTDPTRNTRSELTAFDPAGFTQAAPIRAGGTATAGAASAQGPVGISDGVLVKTRLVAVYTFRRTGSDRVEQVISRRDADLFIASPGGPGRVEVWTGRWNNTIEDVDCMAPDGFLHPLTSASAPTCVRTTRH
ncbi:MAG: hypothetical protein ABIS86_14030 [Streptosporangiaceae bacterium]